MGEMENIKKERKEKNKGGKRGKKFQLLENFFGGMLIEGMVDVCLWGLSISSYPFLRLLSALGYTSSTVVILYALYVLAREIRKPYELALCCSTFSGGTTAFYLLRRLFRV